jgi:hypothetical protein
MRVISVDPGLKPGLVELNESGRVLRVSHKLEDWGFNEPYDLACVEGQWHHAGGKAPVAALLTLAFRAGFTLACMSADRHLRIPPKLWRADWGGPCLTKEQVQKKIALSLTSAERALFSMIPKARHGDALDAIGIGRCAIKVAARTTKWDWKL